jgi:hypothetical protein
MMDRRTWKVVLQRKPILAVIEGNIDGILCSQIEQSLPHRILMNPVTIAEYIFGYA